MQTIVRSYLCIVFALLGAACRSTFTDAPPMEGAPSWEISDPEEYVTFVLFDSASAPELPHSLRYMRADEAPMPFVQEYVASHPEFAGFAFSFIELTRQSAFLVDGRSPKLPANGATALWFAPVDATGFVEAAQGSALAKEIEASVGCVVGLGIWMQDREFVEFLRERGHHAEYGEATLDDDRSGGVRGRLRADGISIDLVARPRGESMTEEEPATQVLFAPRSGPSRAVVISAANPTHRECEAEWTLGGRLGSSHAIRVGPTFRTTYPAALTGRVYPVGTRE